MLVLNLCKAIGGITLEIGLTTACFRDAGQLPCGSCSILFKRCLTIEDKIPAHVRNKPIGQMIISYHIFKYNWHHELVGRMWGLMRVVVLRVCTVTSTLRCIIGK